MRKDVKKGKRKGEDLYVLVEEEVDNDEPLTLEIGLVFIILMYLVPLAVESVVVSDFLISIGDFGYGLLGLFLVLYLAFGRNKGEENEV